MAQVKVMNTYTPITIPTTAPDDSAGAGSGGSAVGVAPLVVVPAAVVVSETLVVPAETVVMTVVVVGAVVTAAVVVSETLVGPAEAVVEEGAEVLEKTFVYAVLVVGGTVVLMVVR